MWLDLRGSGGNDQSFLDIEIVTIAEFAKWNLLLPGSSESLERDETDHQHKYYVG